ncbi:centrosomal protein of 131 kDa-like [Hydractinia symbiolongicarpus]|uniref:centrosomal protein of 131 kDa-like n=1 Tax=Hydractinia symbiolongicarpus TaxID=13093 RepID=UPI00254DB429|nr:centrosomal protein of 131 kDa-like [Hydractinia symbiolongicarpus]
MSSLRRSSSGGNLRSASPNVKRKGSTTKSNGKLSARSTSSSVSDILSVSPMEMNKNKKTVRGNSGRTVTSSQDNLRNPKPQLTQSFNVSYTDGQKGKKSARRPAWSLKPSIEDTPRSEASTIDTYNLPTRPSLDDFLDFRDKETSPPHNKNTGEIHKKSLFEYLSVDTARTNDTFPQDTSKTDNTWDTYRSEESSATSTVNIKPFPYARQKEVNNDVNLEQLDDDDETVIRSWGGKPITKKSTLKKTSSISSKTSNSSVGSSKNVNKNSSRSSLQQNITSKARTNVISENLKKKDYLLLNGNVKKTTYEKSQKSQGENKKFMDRKRELAAACIQLWWRKIRIRKTAGAAAMQRMMENKRKEMEFKLTLERKKEYEKQVEEFEEMSKKEEKARLARQKIIDEMHNKRESQSRKKKDKPVKFMQSNGKVTSTTKNSKQKPVEQPLNEIHKKTKQKEIRPDTASSVARKVDEIFESSSRGSNSPRFLDADSKIDSHSEDESTVVTADVKSGKTTFNDLLNTLKELEDEPIGFTQSSSVELWGNPGRRNKDSLSTEEVHALPMSEEKPMPGSLLSEDKLKTIMSFLDEVEKVEDDVRSEVLSQSKVLYQSKNIPHEEVSAQRDSVIDSASQVASDISNAITAQRLEIDENKRTVDMMKKAMGQQKEFTTMQLREMDKEHKQQLSLQRKEYEATIQRHLSFIDQLIDDKKVLTQRCEDLVSKLKDIDQKYSTKIKQLTENHAVELKKQKEVGEAAEKLRREKWIHEKTQEIKEMTVKGLEPDIQKLIAKHKAEIKKIKAMKQGEVLEADERVGRKYIQQIEDVRSQLEKEKEIAVRKERDNARQRFETQLREEEESYQQQRRRLYNEIEEEKERCAEQTIQMKKEFDDRRNAYEASAKQTLTAALEDHERKLKELQKNHEVDMKNYKEQIDIEKEQWIENYMKKQETQLLSKERQLKEDVLDARDKEIEMVIARLEQETAVNREEAERAAENRIKRIRDKYGNEIKELELSEQNLQEKCSTMKERVEDMENTCIRLKSEAKQKEQEVIDMKKLTDRLQEERGKVSDIIRQEFADRLVALEEESKRLRNELSEEKARHRFDVDRITKDKEDEMEEVHKRVKKAISKKEETTQMLRQQMTAAEKRAEHLEQLLAEQRKKLLTK